MHLVRVMLDLKMPELREIPRDQPLEPQLVRTLREAIVRLNNG